jgi:hypothetical protein
MKAFGLFELFKDIVQIAGARVLRREKSAGDQMMQTKT